MIKVSINGKWQAYWGGMSLPNGAEAIGTVERNTGTGALIRLASGRYVQGNAGGIRTLPQAEVENALARSRAAAALGSATTRKKARAARENGKKGGRPRKQ